MVLENLLSEGFGTVPPFDDTGQLRKEATQAAGALESSSMDVQDTRSPEGFQVTGLTQVAPLAADAGAKAVRTAFGFKG
jgi:hypothetical protein